MKSYNRNLESKIDSSEFPLKNWRKVIRYLIPIYGDVRYLTDMEFYFRKRFGKEPDFADQCMRSIGIIGKYAIYGALIKKIAGLF